MFLVTCEEQSKTVSLLKYNSADGTPVGRVVLHRGVVPPSYLHKKNTCASGTPSSDGKVIYIVVQVGDAHVTTPSLVPTTNRPAPDASIAHTMRGAR